jgi:hypothetical protein
MSSSGDRAVVTLKAIGAVCVVLGLLGLAYHYSYLSADYSGRDNPPYFFQAWHIMAGINIALLLASIVAGIQLFRGKAGWVGAFLVIETLIVVEALLPGLLWLNPRFGRGIAAASGISGGTAVQLIVLFPLWGSGGALWAKRRLLRTAVGA